MFKTGQLIISKVRKPTFDKGRHSRARLGFILMSTDLAAEGVSCSRNAVGAAAQLARIMPYVLPGKAPVRRVEFLGHSARACSHKQRTVVVC